MKTKQNYSSSARILQALMAAGIFLYLEPLTVAGQTLLFSYSFNDSGTTTANGVNGGSPSVQFRNSSNVATDLHGTAGSGVSGAASDLAFDNSTATGMGNAGSGGYAKLASTDANSLTGLTSFTLTGWYKTSGGNVIGNAARLFDSSSFLLYAPTNGTLNLQVNGTVAGSSTTGAYSAAGTWVFFAVTYNSITNQVSFYQGSPSSAASLAGSSASSNIGATTAASTGLFIGNSSGSTRPMEGLMDNFAIYGSTTDGSGALSLDQIQQIQLSSVPESSAFKLGIVGFPLLLGAYCLQRGRTVR